MLNHFSNRHKGVYSEKTFNFDIYLSKIVLYMQCCFGYMLFFFLGFIWKLSSAVWKSTVLNYSVTLRQSSAFVRINMCLCLRLTLTLWHVGCVSLASLTCRLKWRLLVFLYSVPQGCGCDRRWNVSANTVDCMTLFSIVIYFLSDKVWH